jgi:tyrosinase
MGLLRKNYKGMTDDQKKNFVSALYALKKKGVVDNFAQIHAQYFDQGIHRTAHFLPWHREMLYRFELELQKVRHDDGSVHPEITIPYWDSTGGLSISPHWDKTADNSPSSPLWDNTFLGQFNSDWNLKRALGAPALGAPNTHLPTLQQVTTNIQKPTYNTFWDGTDGLELAIHNPPHAWVGGEMNTNSSPLDPAFYLHHCWIDMLWAAWQIYGHEGPQNFVASPSSHGRNWGLNDPLLEWSDRTPANVMDHRKLGYRYDIEHWLAAGDVLNPSDCQFSLGGPYMLLFKMGCLQYQSVYSKEAVLWRSNDPTTDTGNRCIMREDGNLVIYHTDAGPNDLNPIWESNTVGHNNSNLVLGLNGRLEIYDSNWNPLTPKPWSVPPPAKGNPETSGQVVVAD